MPKITTFTLAPSDFGFLYAECKRCYYNKYVNKKFRPKYSLPGIFTVIDGLMTSYFDNKPTSLVSDTLPPGIVTLGALMVKSKPIPCKEHNCQIILEGRVDSLLKFDDGSFGILDFKTTNPYKSDGGFYFYQLMSYLVALEYNDPEKTKSCKISRLGLCCFNPTGFDMGEKQPGLFGDLKWIEIERDSDKFKKFLKEIAGVLTGPLPEANEKCKFCNYKNSD